MQIIVAQNSDKGKWVYSGYRIVFDGKGEWNFGNESARNIAIFGFKNSLSSHTYLGKNDFLVLGEILLMLMEDLVQKKKSLVYFW